MKVRLDQANSCLLSLVIRRDVQGLVITQISPRGRVSRPILINRLLAAPMCPRIARGTATRACLAMPWYVQRDLIVVLAVGYGGRQVEDDRRSTCYLCELEPKSDAVLRNHKTESNDDPSRCIHPLRCFLRPRGYPVSEGTVETFAFMCRRQVAVISAVVSVL